MEIDLKHVAKLAKLSLTEAETEMLGRQLPSIVEYVARLQEVDTTNIDAKAYLTDATNVFRPDVVVANEVEREAVVAAFPKQTGEALEVPGIFK